MKYIVIISALMISTFAFAFDEVEYKKQLMYKAACYAGVESAQKFLPPNDMRDQLKNRGMLSCEGSLARIIKSGELYKEPNIVEFACGYATGSMNSKYGFGEEHLVIGKDKFAKWAMDAMSDCIEKMKKQNVKL